MKALFTIFSYIFLAQITLCQNSTTLSDKIDGYVDPYLKMQAWSGVISIYKNGRPVFEKAYGKADREFGIVNNTDTRFRIASISKIFTEVAILLLEDQNKLKLTDPIERFIPNYPNGEKIQINHLINHSSGIPHLNDFDNYNSLAKYSYELNEIIELFKNKNLDFDPGTDFNYSNSGYVLLAYIIEKVSGYSFEEYLNSAIFQTNFLDGTGVDHHSKIIANRAKGYTFNESVKPINADFVDMSIKIGGGSLYSTSNDLNRFIYLLNKDKIVDGFISRTSFIEKDAEGNEMIILDGRVSGFCSRLVYYLKDDLCITVLGNNYGKIAMSIADDILKIYEGESYQNPKNYLQMEVSLEVGELKSYSGIYDFGFGPKRVIKTINGNLTYQSGEYGNPDKLIPIGNDTFFYLRYWTLVKFRKENSEVFNKIDWIMGDNVWSGVRAGDN